MSHQVKTLCTADRIAAHIAKHHDLEVYESMLMDEILALILKYEAKATRDILEKQRHEEARALDEFRRQHREPCITA